MAPWPAQAPGGSVHQSPTPWGCALIRQPRSGNDLKTFKIIVGFILKVLAGLALVFLGILTLGIGICLGPSESLFGLSGVVVWMILSIGCFVALALLILSSIVKLARGSPDKPDTPTLPTDSTTRDNNHRES